MERVQILDSLRQNMPQLKQKQVRTLGHGIVCGAVALALALPSMGADVSKSSANSAGQGANKGGTAKPAAPSGSPAGIGANGDRIAYTEQLPKSLAKFDMIPIPAGTLKTGDKEVQIKPFWIGKTEVRWDEYDVFFIRLDLTDQEKERMAPTIAKTRPSMPYGAPDRGFGHAGYPAVSITYQAAQAYCTWLSNKTGKKYRLPTEAEYEYAARAGATEPTIDPAGLDKVAWYWDNADDKTHPVARKAPNAWGLYDMLGNAGEWSTAADGSGVLMGGTFNDKPAKINYNTRAPYTKDWQVTDPQNPKSKWWLSDGPFCGLRVVREG